jgi:tetratricopeptide (TPR) repeat protein
MSSNISHPKVFISYSWDSEEHKNSVLDLADRLRNHGIDCDIDQFEVYPSEGWQNWMRNQVEQSDFVIVICTEQYKKRFQGKEELGKGKGVTWEGVIINQLIYDQVSSTKFIPVIFSAQAGIYIPTELRRFTYYLLDSCNLNFDDQGYESLYRQLTNQSLKKGSLGKIISLPPRPRHQINPPIKEQEIQQEKLTKSYQEAQRFYRARHWKKVISIFQQMQEDNLPFFDPDGIYRLTHNELLKQQQQTRRLNNIYTQGVKYYQAKDWFEAQKKFEEILRFYPNDRDLQIKVEQKLKQVQEQLKKEKYISRALIVLAWLLSVFFPIPSINTGVIGGFFSAIVIWRIWWISQRTKRLEASKKVCKFFLFILIGVFIEVIIWKILGLLPDFQKKDLIIPGFALIFGIVISIKMMFWQIQRIFQDC